MAAENLAFDAYKKKISGGVVKPVNVLHGEEGYFLDVLVELFETIIPEEDRDLSLTNIYAPQVNNPQEIIDICRQVPMMTERQVVILREAQNVKADFLDKLASYVSSPTPSTVFVIVSRGEKLKGKEILKAASKENVDCFESPKIWENQVPRLIVEYVKSKNLNLENRSADLLAEYIGTNLSRLYNEIDKLAQILGPGSTITVESIERNIGISKDYNNFELVDAVAARDFAKMIKISRYFQANPSSNPYPVTTAALFNFFADLLQAFYASDKSERGLQQELGIRGSMAVKRLMLGMKNYNAFQIIEILDAIRTYDAMSKGSGSRQDPYKMLIDLMFHINTAPGKLPV